MLSVDELSNGINFILKLRDATGAPFQWVEMLRGAIATRWYGIYRRSDWSALRMEAAEVFRNPVSEEQAERIRKSNRCIVIRTRAVAANDLVAALKAKVPTTSSP
jgi:hypothetical protein